MQQVLVHRAVEQRFRQRDPPSCWRPPPSNEERQSWRLRPPCLRTVTRPFIGPGTEPRTNKRLRLGVDPDDPQAELGGVAGAHVPRHPLALRLMRDGCPAAIDPGLRCRVLAVRLRTRRGEVMAVYDALKAAAPSTRRWTLHTIASAKIATGDGAAGGRRIARSHRSAGSRGASLSTPAFFT